MRRKIERQHREPLCDFVFGVFAARKNERIVPLVTAAIERKTGCQVSRLEATVKKRAEAHHQDGSSHTSQVSLPKLYSYRKTTTKRKEKKLRGLLLTEKLYRHASVCS